LIGINLFGVLGGLYLWFPKMTGRMMGEGLGKAAFWVTFFGFNLAFLPMHWTGLLGMPRRIYTYPEGAGWTTVNVISTVGSFILAAGLAMVALNVVQGLRRGRAAGENPWDVPTLEWAIPSPPPPYNFAVIPVIASRHPLWEERLDEGTGRSSLYHGLLLDRGKETILTTMLDAEPDKIAKMPEDSLWPLITTIVLTFGFSGMLFQMWWLTGLSVAALLGCILLWLWPQRSLEQTARPTHE
ncbi:MAG: cbb3-type cytochrome c oxidase subunit I, partial [Tranquillimonas sp.]